MKFYFTFPCGIDNPYRNCYHIIEAEDSNSARKAMIEKFGMKWAFQYKSAEAAGVEEFNLREIK